MDRLNEKNMIKEKINKICPFRSLLSTPSFCLQEGCEFWDEQNKQCLFLTQNQILIELTQAIAQTLADFHSLIEKLTDLLEELTREEAHYF